jgi:hypothetical protein
MRLPKHFSGFNETYEVAVGGFNEIVESMTIYV